MLIVEDNPTNQRVLRLMLSKMNYDVRVASDGVQALRFLERETFDIVLMDCEMPNLDGFETTRSIRASEGSLRRVPIVAVTGKTRERDRELCFEVGMDDYIPKPVASDELQRALQRWTRSESRAG